MKNIRSLLKAGVAGFQCYLDEPDGMCGGKQIIQPEKRKAPWLNRSMTVNTALIPPSTNHNGMKELITTLSSRFYLLVQNCNGVSYECNYNIKVRMASHLPPLLTQESFHGWT